MIIIHDIQEAAAKEPNALDYLTGIGTLVLGLATIILGLLNYRLSNMVKSESKRSAEKDRRVHLADKRHDWVRELRETVSGFLSAIQEVTTAKKTNDYHDALNISNKVGLLTNKTRLLLLPEGNNTADQLLSKMTEYVQVAMVEKRPMDIDKRKEYDDRILDIDAEVSLLAKSIIETEWEKIKNLAD